MALVSKNNSFIYSEDLELECFPGICFDEFLVVPIFCFLLLWNAPLDVEPCCHYALSGRMALVSKNNSSEDLELECFP